MKTTQYSEEYKPSPRLTNVKQINGVNTRA